MNDITDIAEVYDLLYRLGFSATNTAFFQLSYAVYHNFGTPLIGSVFLSNHILPRFAASLFILPMITLLHLFVCRIPYLIGLAKHHLLIRLHKSS